MEVEKKVITGIDSAALEENPIESAYMKALTKRTVFFNAYEEPADSHH